MRLPHIVKIACLLCAATLPVAVQAQFTFVTNADSTITITGYTGPGGDETIPDTIDGLPVTSIGDWAFYGASITKVVIPDSVTNIGGYAFELCSGLTSVTISKSVTSIGGQAFYYCTSLTNVMIPDSVTDIGYYVFAGCASLTSVVSLN